MTYIDFHLPVEPIVEQEIVGHANPVGFHWMALAIVVVPNITWMVQKGDVLNSLQNNHYN